MRGILRVAIPAVVVMGIAAPATSAKTQLTIYFQWEPALETLQQAVDLYESRNPGVDVQIVPACIDCGSGYEKLITAIAAGTPPDLVTLSGSYYVEMARKGFLEPLGRYLAVTDWRTKYHPALWETGMIDGEVYGLPAFEGGPGRGLIYNRDILAERGVAEPGPDQVMTWDEFGAMARKLAGYNAEGRLIQVGFYPKETGANSLGNMSIAYNVEWFNERTGLAQMDQPALAEAMEMLKRHFYDPWGYQAVEAAVRGKGLWTNHMNSLFATRGSATLVTGYWSPGELRKTMPGGNLGVTWIPNNARLKVQTIGAWRLTMLSGSKAKSEAWRLLQFLASPETTRLFFEGMGWLGGMHRDVAREINLRNNPGAAWYVQSLDRADRVISGKPNLYSSLASRLWSEAYEKVVSGQGSARPLLEEANRVVNARILEDRQLQR